MLTRVCDEGPGSDRTLCSVLIDVPAGCGATESPTCPLLFFFHGSGGNNERWLRGGRRSASALVRDRARTFVGVYVQGDLKPSGSPGWATCSACDEDGVERVDDLAFVMQITSRLQELGNYGRRYAYGSSNGAGMALRIATNGALGFSGIVYAVTQLLISPERNGAYYNYPTAGSGTRAIAVLAMHGSADTNLKIGGGDSPPGCTACILSSSADSIRLWAKVNGCAEGREERLDATYSWDGPGDASGVADRLTFECEAHVPTEYVLARCAGHSGASTIDGKSSLDYAIDFLAEVEEACAASPTGVCESPPVFAPATNTSWPDYPEPECQDTESQCVCTGGVTSTWFSLPPALNSSPLPPAAPASPPLPWSPSPSLSPFLPPSLPPLSPSPSLPPSPPTFCEEFAQFLEGDLNHRNGFTLGDAIWAAQVWAGQQEFAWKAHASYYPWNVCSDTRARSLREESQLPDQMESAEVRGELLASRARVAQLEQLLKEKDKELKEKDKELTQHAQVVTDLTEKLR